MIYITAPRGLDCLLAYVREEVVGTDKGVHHRNSSGSLIASRMVKNE